MSHLKQMINERDLAIHSMKLQLEEYHSSLEVDKESLLESENARVNLQKEYERCTNEYNSKLKD